MANISIISRTHDWLGAIVVIVLLGSFFTTPLLMLAENGNAAPTGFWRKWYRYGLPGGGDGVVIGDMNNDGIQEIVKAGVNRTVAIRGTDGKTVWSVSTLGVGATAHPQMADLDGDGYLEVVVPIREPQYDVKPPQAGFYILDGRSGSIEMRINQSGRTDSSPVIADIDGDGYPTIFFPTMSFVEITDDSNSTGRLISYKYNMGNSPRYKKVAETKLWHPCSGGLSIADTDNDGEFELYMGDRDMYYVYPYVGSTSGDRGYGNGVVSFWAKNLTERWRHPDLLVSSAIPMLADVNNDGVLDVIATPQRGGIAVLNSKDGTAIRKQLTIYNSNGQPISGHYQSSVYDIDHDGNLEILMADGEHDITHDAVVWDLVQWKEDARISSKLIGQAYFGPQIGEVTGDGIMDVVLTNYTRLFVFDGAHDPTSDHTYPLVWMSDNLTGRLLYPVMQDIDNDGYTEIVVASQSGFVYAFGTPASAPYPRPRTEVPFYSERKTGVAEYIPPLAAKSGKGVGSSSATSPTLAAITSTTSMLMPFNKSSSTEVTDYSGYGNNGRIKGNVTWTGNGMIGGAYDFNGGYITIPDSDSLDGNNKWYSMSAELWLYLSANQNGTRVLFKQPSYEIGLRARAQKTVYKNQLFAGIWTLQYNTVNKRTYADYAEVVYTTTSLSLNKWYHVAFTYQSGDRLRLYVNSVLVDSEYQSGPIQRGLQPVYLGWFDYFKGMIDEVKIFSRQLTSTEIKNDYLYSGQPPRINTFTPVSTTPSVNEGARLDFTQTSSDPDGGTLTYSWKLDSVQVATTQNWTCFPGYDDAGTHTVIIKVTDNNGYYVTQQWTVTVKEANAPPTIDSFSPQNDPTIYEGGQQKFSITYSDPENDPTTVHWYLNGTPNSTTNSYTFVAAAGSEGIYNVTVVVSDPFAQTSHRWTLAVLHSNNPPVIDSYSPMTNPVINEGQSQTFNITWHDPDGDLASVKWFLNKQPTNTTTNSYTYVSNYGSSGTYNVTVAVTDEHQAQTTHEWSLTVHKVNRAPTINSYTPTNPEPQVNEGDTLSFTQTSSDSDGDSLTTSWFLDQILRANAQNWTYTPNYDEEGFHNVTLMVSDGSLFDTKQWNVQVIRVNMPPVIISYTPVDSQPKVGEGIAVPFTQISSDPNKDPMSYSWLLNNIQQAVAQNWTYTPSSGNFGNYNVTVKVSDPDGLFTTHYWNMSVVHAYQVTIEIQGNGGTTPASGTHQYLEGTTVSVQAIPAYGWKLDYWLLNNVSAGSNNPYNIVVDKEYTLTAVFIQFLHTVTLESTQNTATSSNLGSIKFDGASYSPLPQNTSEALASYSVEYFAATGYIFDHWVTFGGLSVSSASANPTMANVSGAGTLRAVYRATIFADGFESGNFAKWSGTSVSSGDTATVSSTLAHHGNYSGLFTTNGAGGTEWVYSYYTINENEVFARGYFYVSSGLPLIDSGDNFYFLRLRGNGQTFTGAGIRHSSTGVDRWVLTARQGSGWAMTAYGSSPAIQMGRWYSIELHWKLDSVNGYVEMYVDGVKILQTTRINTAYYGNATSINFGLSEILNVQNKLKVYGDCFVLSRSYIGPESSSVQSLQLFGIESQTINDASSSSLTKADSWIAILSLLSMALVVNLRRSKRRLQRSPPHLNG